MRLSEAVAIAGDNVDPERLASAERWNIERIRSFMVVFGLISTVFDLLLFVWLLKVMDAGRAVFRTAWLVASLLNELLVPVVLRTGRPFYRSTPSALLGWSTALVAAIALALPYAGGVAGLFLLVPLDARLMAVLLGVVILHAAVTELAKRRHHLLGA